MTLDAKHGSYLRTLAHHRAPAVTASAAGIAASGIAPIECALEHHERVKIRAAVIACNEGRAIGKSAG